MQKKTIYLLLTLVGVVVPMIAFIPWVTEHGINLRLLAAELFVNRVSTFFALDLIATGVVVAAFARAERGRVPRVWIPIVVMLCVGVSAGLPLLLFLREKALTAEAAQSRVSSH